MSMDNITGNSQFFRKKNRSEFFFVNFLLKKNVLFTLVELIFYTEQGRGRYFIIFDRSARCVTVTGTRGGGGREPTTTKE